MYLVGDFETSNEAELTEVGLYNYAVHPSARVLMFSYAFVETLFDIPIIKRWEPHKEPMHEELFAALKNPNVNIIAFNSAFERYIFQYVLGITIPAERFQDPQASARYLSLPASLEDVGTVLGLPYELRKDKRGEELIKLFCLPKTHTNKQLKANPSLPSIYFNTWETHPVEWNQFGEYCDQDVRAELEIARRELLLGVFPLPKRERNIWLFDQKVNDRGMPVDRKFVQNMFDIAQKNKEEKLQEQNERTGLENANSAIQLLPWVQDLGYPLSNLRKQNIELVLKDPSVDMHEDAKTVLKARMVASSTSYKKLQTILRNITQDDKIKNMFIYMGSSRCGRWSGASVQPHNFARPDGLFEDMKNVNRARFLIYGSAYEELKTEFKNEKTKEYYAPLTIAKNLIRTVFVAPRGKRFNVCDLKAIETAVGAWVAQCESLLDTLRRGRDPYLDFASKMTGIPYEKLEADIKSKDPKIKAAAKRLRQIAKPGVLGAIYRLGPGGWGRDKNGDKIKTGLWGYAEAMGIDMTQEEAASVVKIFRESYPEICGNGYSGSVKGIWILLEEAVMDVLKGERTVRNVGPNGCIKIDKLTIEGRKPILRIQLPSGRYLHYMDAGIETVKMPWQRMKDMPVEFNSNGEATKYEPQLVDEYRPAFTYYGKDQTTDQWNLIVSHGGKIFENVVQGIARDVLADKLLRFEEIGLETVGHVHDEGICLSDDDPFAPGVLEMEKIMSTPLSWAPGLPLAAAGFEDSFYHK